MPKSRRRNQRRSSSSTETERPEFGEGAIGGGDEDVGGVAREPGPGVEDTGGGEGGDRDREREAAVAEEGGGAEDAKGLGPGVV